MKIVINDPCRKTEFVKLNQGDLFLSDYPNKNALYMKTQRIKFDGGSPEESCGHAVNLVTGLFTEFGNMSSVVIMDGTLTVQNRLEVRL